jgi:sugar lactone lactonase YvrE
MNPSLALRTAARTALLSSTALAAALLTAPLARAQANYATPYTFNTFVGTPYFPTGADGTGPAAQFYAPAASAIDSSGNLYVADQGDETIRMITPSGVVTTIAGKALVVGSSDGTGSAALFNLPNGVALDGKGNLFVADTGNGTIRQIVLSTGAVTTIAGTAGATGANDGTGPAAQFDSPISVAVDGSGNLFVSDFYNNTIRKITMPGAVVTTFAGTAPVAGVIDGTGAAARFHLPYGVAIDGSGNVYVADSYNDTIRKITSAGVVTTLAGKAGNQGHADGTGASAQFYSPEGVAVDSGGDVYVADAGNDTIRKVTSGGGVTTIAGAVGFSGFVNGTGTGAEFSEPAGVSVDAGGNVYVSDQGNGSMRVITPSGAVTTLAGTSGQGFADGTGAAARLYYPEDLAIDGNGNLYVADEENCTIRKVTPAGVVTTIAGTPGYIGSADGTGPAAQFYYPYGVALDGNGNLFITDQGNQTIRKLVLSTGAVTTIAGSPGVQGSTNGTGSAALFYFPAGIAADSNDNLYVSEQRNFDIRMITSAGVVTTLAGTPGAIGHQDGTGPAAGFDAPAGVLLDGKGNLFVADLANATIRKIVISTGVVTTFAGIPTIQGDLDGPAASAQFGGPSGMALDASGNMYVADWKNNTIREISAAGVVTTLAGTTPAILPPHSPPVPPQDLYANGTGSAALFDQPFDVVVDKSGNLFVTDARYNDAIRMGTLSGAPFIQTAPTDQYAAPGSSATFTVSASGSSTLTYQWNFNGAPIGGATGSSYTISNVQASNGGPYTVTVTDSDGSTTSSAATLYVSSGSSGARLVNISTRAMVGTGGNILIPGFVIGGSGTESLLIRADGPALTQFGVSGALAAPSLTVINSAGATVASNTGWGTNPNPAQIASVAAQVGAFALSSGSADCALIANLGPGSYTVQVSGVGSTTGVALAEIYEVSSTGTARLINISTRALVGTGANILIPGFVIGGTGTEQLLVRGDGPALTQFGVSGALAAPSLGVYNSAGTEIASNIGWGTSTTPAPSQIASVAAFVGAFALTANSADCAQVVNLSPGAYTIQISGVSSTTGVALAEVYEVP